MSYNSANIAKEKQDTGQQETGWLGKRLHYPSKAGALSLRTSRSKPGNDRGGACVRDKHLGEWEGMCEDLGVNRNEKKSNRPGAS